MKIEQTVLRVAIAASVAVSGVIHAYLYINGYRDIPTVGPGFLLQASVFCALALLILVGGPLWLHLVAAAGAAGSLVAFALSRTVGLFGFIETGWQPSPYTWLSVLAEAATIALVGIAVVRRRSPSADVAQHSHSNSAPTLGR
ncbi:hypothetical protein DVS77_31880 [Mycolicibacterium moriokaense]|nr:hypothetical protein DVS77_31880 [Mycolicibacterium moriokaense]